MTVMRVRRILFVCTGNICRSPTAEAVFSRLIAERGMQAAFEVDSAGTHAHRRTGAGPDSRAVVAAARRGIDLSPLRARGVEREDFFRFDLIIAMDRYNHEVLSRLCPPGCEQRLKLFMSYAPDWNTLEIPDPYGGGEQLFDLVLDRIEASAQGLLEALCATGSQRAR